MYYDIEYYAGTYSGVHTVRADDEQEAKDKTRGWVRRQMLMPMCTDGYKVIKTWERDDDERDDD